MPEKSNNTPRWLEVMYSQSASELKATVKIISNELARVMANMQNRENPKALIDAYNCKLNIANELIGYHTAAILTATPI